MARLPLIQDNEATGVVAAAFDMMTVDGMNEAGLSGHILWLAESDYGTYDPSRPALSMAVWMQYFLDNFATVAEAAAWIEQTEVQVVPLGDPATGEVPTVHLALDDATGDSAIVEYVDGKATVWHDRGYQVMTNSPTYDKQLELLREVLGVVVRPDRDGERLLAEVGCGVERLAAAAAGRARRGGEGKGDGAGRSGGDASRGGHVIPPGASERLSDCCTASEGTAMDRGTCWRPVFAIVTIRIQ